MKHSRDLHQLHVKTFLRQEIANQDWQITRPPHGSGQETYFASGSSREVFIKLGARVELYQSAAWLGLVPPVIHSGQLEDGTTILVQARMQGRKPSRADFQRHLGQFAESLRILHNSEALQGLLPPRRSNLYQDVGFEMLAEVEHRWRAVIPGLPLPVVSYIEEKIAYLRDCLAQFQGGGLAASHNDPCNANWLVTEEGRIYLLDLEAMGLDDPALDLGAVLWWYYPPALRPQFLAIAGCPDDAAFRERMRVRMAIHNLHILLPRPGSFDRFDPQSFAADLVDFQAVVEGMENPQGYED